MRERVFLLLDRALANPEPAPPRAEAVPARPEATPLPETEARIDAPSAPLPRERLLRGIGLLVPGWLRGEFLGSLMAQRHAMRGGGASRARIALFTAREMANGVAQRAPLAEMPDARRKEERDRTSLIGRAAWRLSGPLLLLGHLTGTVALLLLGVAAVGGALGCVLKATLANGWEKSADRVRLVNGVLGPLVVLLTSALPLALPAGALFALSAVTGIGALAGASVHLFVFGLFGVAALVSGSGWSPEPWTTRHLVRVTIR